MAAIAQSRAAFWQIPAIIHTMSTTSVSAQVTTPARDRRRRVVEGAAFSVIMALSFSHFLNDMMQSLVPALYPMLKGAYGLSFAQIGLITLIMQLTSSLL